MPRRPPVHRNIARCTAQAVTTNQRGGRKGRRGGWESVSRTGRSLRAAPAIVTIDRMETDSELKLVTCLFVDIVGSTDAVVRIGPERMQRLLSDGFAQISGLIKAQRGVVEKYVGDA